MDLKKMFKTLEMPIRKLGVDMVNEIISVLESKDKVASGKLINSIKHEYRIDIDNIELLIKSEDYIKFLESGRRPGKYVPIKALKEWVKFKGIPEKAIYPINHKIFKFGIKPVQILKPIVDKYNKPDRFGGIIKQYNRIVADYLKWEFQQIEKNMK
jgi:hypothetical protein